MHLTKFKDAQERIDMTRSCIEAGDSLLDVHKEIIETALSRYERDLLADYQWRRLYAIARHMTPKHKWDMPEAEKPLRLLKLRYWSEGFDRFECEQNGDEFEIHLRKWAGESEDRESFSVPGSWLGMEWTELVPIMDAHMKSEWAAERILQNSAVARAEQDLKNAQARLDALKGN